MDRALKQKFYLEAMFIEYAIMEDRCDSILGYENNQIKSKNFVSIDRKLDKIKKIAEQMLVRLQGRFCHKFTM